EQVERRDEIVARLHALGVVRQRRRGYEVVAAEEEEVIPFEIARGLEAGLGLRAERGVGGVDVAAPVPLCGLLGLGLRAADQHIDLDARQSVPLRERGVVRGPEVEQRRATPRESRYEDPDAQRTLRAGQPSHVPPSVSRLTKDMAPTVVSSASVTPWCSTAWVPTKQRAPTWAPPTLCRS